MSLPVAIQSVLYYILSCSTCNKVIHRHKAKAQAQKDRAEKQQIETEQPGLYRHPSPFRTNPYWEEEIALGPNPKSKKKSGGGDSTKGLNPANGGGGAGSSVGTSGSSIPSLAEGSRISGEGWNRKLYQRENEPLWGYDTPGPGQRIKDAIARAGSTTKQLFEQTLTSHKDHDEDHSDGDEERRNVKSYFLGKNPPVNDLHPPVVTTMPANRGEMSWMLQPPPSAKVMEGKERVASLRSRADSGASSRRGAETPLSRKVTEKLTASRLSLGVPGEMHELRPTSSRLSSGPPTYLGRLESSSSESESKSMKSRRNKKGLSVAVPAPTKPAKTVLRSDPEMRERPKLEPIPSSSMAIPQFQGKGKALETVTDSRVNMRPGEEGLSPNKKAMPAGLPSMNSPKFEDFVFPGRGAEQTTAVEHVEAA